MKIHPSIKRAALIAIALVLEAIDKRITEDLEQPLEAPKQSRPSKYATVRIDTSSEPIRPYITTYNPSTGIITTTTSKDTKEQLQAIFIENPYKSNGFTKDKNLY